MRAGGAAPAALTRALPPRRRPGTVSRRRLLDEMHRHIERRLHMVVAPAGYGKTTLLAEFAHEVAEHGVPVCWLTLDGSDTDPRTFFEDVLLALGRQFQGVGARTAALLRSVEDVGREARAVTAALCAEIQEDADEFCLLVLDDYHLVHESVAVNVALDAMLERLPDGYRVALGSRTIPTRLDLVRLAARLDVAGVGTDDLRFTADEAAGLIRAQQGVDIHPGEALRAVQRAEGWVTALVLSLQTEETARFANLSRSASHTQPLYEYLARQVFERQPEPVQRFLRESAVLPALSAADCDAVLGRTDSAGRLPDLLRAGLFIEPLAAPRDGVALGERPQPLAEDEPVAWYRYHELWRSFLLWRLERHDPARLAELRRRAAQLALERGDVDAAVRQHLEHGGDPRAAAAMVQRVAEGELASGRAARLAFWMEALPDRVLDAHPMLLVHHARALRRLDRAKEALAAVERAARLASERREWDSLYLARAWRVEMLAVLGRRDEVLAAVSPLLDFSNRQTPPARVLVQMEKEACLALAMCGRYRDSQLHGARVLDGLRHLAASRERTYAAATTHHVLGIACARLGEVAAAEEHYQEAGKLWHRLGNAAYEAALINMVGVLRQENGDEAAALVQFKRALELAERVAHLSSQAAVLANVARSHRRQHDLQEAHQAIERALPLARQLDEPRLLGESLQEATLVALRRQDLAEATHCALAARDVADDRWPAGRASTNGLLAVAHARARNVHGARTAISAARQALGPVPSPLERLRVEVATAAARASLRDESAAAALRATRRWARDTQRLSSFFVECLEFAETAGLLLAQRNLPAEVEARAQALLDAGAAPAAAPRRAALRSVPAPVHADQFQVRVLGTPALLHNGKAVTRWRTTLARDLLFYLALQEGSFVRSETLVDVLLPDESLERGQTALHYAVYHLRRAFAPLSPVVSVEGGYQLALDDRVHCDAVDFNRLLARARALTGDAQLDTLETAVGLYNGELLAGLDADWVLAVRADMSRKFLSTAQTLLAAYERGGQHEAALHLAQRVVALEPFQEEFHLALLRHHVALGHRAAARRHYRLYSHVMRTELGQEPTGEAARLIAAAGAHDAGPR